MNPKYWIYHPDIYPETKDDRNPDDIEIPEGCIFHYYGVGMIGYVPGKRMSVHIHILPKYRKDAKQIALDSLSKIDGEVETIIPVCFKHIKIFALRCGFKVEKIIKNDYLRNGRWYDSTLMVR